MVWTPPGLLLALVLVLLLLLLLLLLPGRCSLALSKTHAAIAGRPIRGGRPGTGRVGARSCDSAIAGSVSLAQYKPLRWTGLRRWAALALLAALPGLGWAGPASPLGHRAGQPASRCPGPQLDFKPAGPGVWWVPARRGEADAANRGQVSNLLLARSGGGSLARLWALGSGPSPALGAALACQARQRLGLPLTMVISPWARPELVLGVAGVQRVQPDARHAAHAAVAEAMAAQCPHCVDRLGQRLGAAAADLGADPIRLPTLRLQGEHGRLGPFLWWRLARAEGRWVTVWRLRSQPLWLAPGLLTEGSPPDGRDADLAALLPSLQQLAALAQQDGAAARWLGEQGGWMGAGAPLAHAAYWQALKAAVGSAIERGDLEAAAAPALPAGPGWSAGWAGHPWHGLNWQRAWRQMEPELLAAPPR